MSTQSVQYEEGQTASHPDGRRVIYRNGSWVNDTSRAQQPRRAAPSSTDQEALAEASRIAQSERDAMREYSQAESAVRRMDTGPVKARYLDAITPEEDGGVLDAVGGFLGTPLRWMVDDDTFAARDHLRTVNAGVALEGSSQMKGSSSDKDTALMRMAGVSPYKTVTENQRIIREARRHSGLSQVRAKTRARWINLHGSLSAQNGSGRSYEDFLTATESAYNRRMDALERGDRETATAPPPRRSRGATVDRQTRRPQAPPRKSRSETVTIDLNGNRL